jgi:diguanylate cyclase (GGDEF)-like protein
MRRTMPFAIAACLAFALVPLPPSEEHPVALLAAAVVTVLIIGSAVFVPWQRMPDWTQAVPPMAYFLAIGFLRHAEGGAASGYGTLVLLPLVWLVLYGTRRQLFFALNSMVVMFAVPILLIGPPLYPPSEWRRTLMWATVGPLIALTVHRLVVEIHQLLAQLGALARTDALTGIPNRRAWDEEMPRELSRARRSGEPLAVALLDLDHFKAFNDSRGHQAGDQLLKEAAAAWTEQIRDGDFLARYGGEEFALLLPVCSKNMAHAVAERLRCVVPDGQTCSLGVATWDGAESPEALIRRTDEALYEAKLTGRDRVMAAS